MVLGTPTPSVHTPSLSYSNSNLGVNILRSHQLTLRKGDYPEWAWLDNQVSPEQGVCASWQAQERFRRRETPCKALRRKGPPGKTCKRPGGAERSPGRSRQGTGTSFYRSKEPRPTTWWIRKRTPSPKSEQNLANTVILALRDWTENRAMPCPDYSHWGIGKSPWITSVCPTLFLLHNNYNDEDS